MWHQASEVASELMLTYGLPESDQAPDPYAEFRLRTPVAARHEPAARRRAAGHQIR
jgi:hypothetical protein